MEKTCIGSIPVIPPCEDYPVTFEVVEAEITTRVDVIHPQH